MKLGRYLGGGSVVVEDAEVPVCPPGGVLVRTEASGICTGELMDWYMDRKAPHVLGHEVSGVVVESDAEKFPTGRRIFVHHHAPCFDCEACFRRAYVHCETWKRTRLDPGGMAEFFAASAENLNDALLVENLSAADAALIEPLACVAKSLSQARYDIEHDTFAVVGLGFLGLAHALVTEGAVGYELDEGRRAYAASLGIEARHPDEAEPNSASCVIVCPGSPEALELALRIVKPQGRIGLFAPMPPGRVGLDLEAMYFKDVTLSNSYSCGPTDTQQAYLWLAKGRVSAGQLVTERVGIDDLPGAYGRMKRQETLKAMVVFGW